MSELVQNYLRIKAEVEQLGKGKTRLLPVSKTFPISDILELYQAAQAREFAENRVQELKEKSDALPKDIIWHFIGTLQSNKVRKVVQSAHVIHSVESQELLERVDRIAGEENRPVKILLEVNVSGELSKSGMSPEALPAVMEQAIRCSHIRCIGLMTMAPAGASDEELQRYFSHLATLRDEMEKRFAIELPELSMGMSSDFIHAIENGSTIVRVGTAIFGGRDYGVKQ